MGVSMYRIREVDDFVIISVETEEIKLELLNYGAAIYGLQTKDYLGNFEDIVIRYKDINDYINNNIYLNATIGPIAGRVKDGLIQTKKKTFKLDKNSEGLHCLHSGSLALSYKFFDYEISDFSDYTEVAFLYEEKDVIDYLVKVFYRIYKNRIEIIFEVDCEEDFVFNLTNHAYFNLSGNLKRNIRNHQVYLASNLRHELSDELVATGNVIAEKGIYDFSKEKEVEIAVKELENTPKGGVDDIYYFPNNDLRKIQASVYDPISRRLMKVKSSYDNMVFYTHNNINDLQVEHLPKHQKHYALCFECQKSPYGFESKEASNPLLKKGRLYQEKMIYEFFVK